MADTPITHLVLRLLVRELTTMKAEVRAMPSRDALWACPPGVTNSVGTLALHGAGNLRHYIGAHLGGTGYVRDRDREFTARDLSAETVMEELDAAISDLERVLPEVPADRLLAYVDIAGGRVRVDRFLIHLCAHLALHVGQAGYLRRMLTGDPVSVGVTPLSALFD